MENLNSFSRNVDIPDLQLKFLLVIILEIIKFIKSNRFSLRRCQIRVAFGAKCIIGSSNEEDDDDGD